MGNRTPGSHVATRLRLAVVQGNLFQLTHMLRGNHAQSIASNGDQKEDKTILQHSQLSQHGEYMSVNASDHNRVVRIFVCLS